MERYFKNIFLLILLLLANVAFGQRIDQRWMMGYESYVGIPFGGTDIVFQSSGPSISYINRPMNFSDASITICDTSNNVLFYSNGIYIANHLNDTMMNGSGLSPSWYTSSTDYYGLTIPQSIIAIPAPGDINRYYLFHNTVDDSIQYSYFLYYSIVDMSLDGGLGAVINKNIILLHDTIVPGRITATKHANGRDWWIVVHCSEISATPNRFYIYLLTPSGLQLSHTQDIGHRFIEIGRAHV